MVLIFAAGLLVSLTVALILFMVPQGRYDVAPAMAAVDFAKHGVNKWLLTDKGTLLKTIKRTGEEVVKKGLLTGVMFAFLAFLLSVAFIGPFSIILAVIFFFAGIFLTQKLLEKEFKKWQEKLYSGVPQLVNFVPAFLEIEGITVREAIEYTISFLPDPLRQEMWQVLDKIKRTARVHEALEDLAAKAQNPAVDAVCFRLSANWDADISPDIFDDLNDQIEDMNEMVITRATVAKTGYLALICVLGIVGMIMIYGYPGFKYMMSNLTGGFGL